ncbi:MAG TPA: GNAT family N-acetyltransferase [Euzebyales bacterium]
MEIRPLRPEDAEQAFQLRVHAFSSSTRGDYDAAEVYAPDEHRLVAVDGGRVVGHLAVWPVHQSFGGRAVPMAAVSAFTIAHDQRGRGIGSQMLTVALERMADAGLAISTLYPSTPVPYHRWGWEFAGEHVRRRVATRALLDVPAPAVPVELRPYAPADLDALVELNDRRAQREPGALIGGDRWLRRALQADPDEPELAVVAVRDGQVAGLLLAVKESADDGIYGLHVLRLFGADRDVERALLRCAGHHHAVAATSVLRSRTADPLLFELSSLTHLDPACEHFMTRVIDAPAAMTARGWAPVSATIELDISDERRSANHGRFVLEVADRFAVLTPGGSGRVALDVRALASLYTGFTTASALAAAGRVSGDPPTVAAMDDAFAAPAPCMRDTY